MEGADETGIFSFLGLLGHCKAVDSSDLCVSGVQPTLPGPAGHPHGFCTFTSLFLSPKSTFPFYQPILY